MQPLIPSRRVKGEITVTYIRPPDRRAELRSLLLEAGDDLLVSAVEYAPSQPLRRRGEVVLDRGYWGIWFLFKDRPYDVGRVYRPDGTWTGYYVDVLDEDEFEEAERLGHISRDQADRARDVLRQLVREVEGGTFPPAPARAFHL